MAYSDIDSGKVLNKEGLLELSGQIKGYINTNIPQPYTLPTATTSTLGGVKVDGETITITDGVISAVGGSGSGGATYTAGKGIIIDSNNVISNTYQPDIIFDILMQMAGISHSVSFGVSDETNSYTVDNVGAILKSTKALNTRYLSRQTQINGTQLITYLGADATLMQYDIDENGTFTFDSINSRWFYIRPQRLIFYANNKIISLSYDYTNKVFPWIKNSFTPPTPPTTDGNYVLKVSVSSGTPTYSWVAE